MSRAGLVLFALAGSSLAAEADLEAHLALLGDQVVGERLQAPVLEQPARWFGPRQGSYVYRYVAGDDHGKREQLERHEPDRTRPGQAWTRHIGEALIEHMEIVDGHAVRLYTETDREHGYRVEMTPGVHFHAGLKAGDQWHSDNQLTVFELNADGEPDYQGRMQATHTYLGSWRIRVPAGEFNAALIHDDYQLHVGPLKVEDERFAFYARDVGLVAEVEGVRASALLVFRMAAESAKVLVDYPEKPAR